MQQTYVFVYKVGHLEVTSMPSAEKHGHASFMFRIHSELMKDRRTALATAWAVLTGCAFWVHAAGQFSLYELTVSNCIAVSH